MWQRFTELAQQSILLGQEEAARMKMGSVEPEHIFLGLIGNNDIATQILQGTGVPLDTLRQEIENELSVGTAVIVPEPKLSPGGMRILEVATNAAARVGAKYIGVEHLLLAFLSEQDSSLLRILHRLGINIDEKCLQACRHYDVELTPHLKSVSYDEEQVEKLKGTLISRYLQSEMARNIQIPEVLQDLDLDWAQVTAQQHSAVERDLYQLAIELREQATHVEEQFVQFMQKWQAI